MEPEPEALCSAFMPSVGYRWEFGIVTCGRAPWGSLPSPVLTELPAEQSAESLLFGLDGLQKDDLTLRSIACLAVNERRHRYCTRHSHAVFF